MVRNSELLQKSGNVIWTDLDRFKEQLAEKEKCVQHDKTHIKAHYYIEDSSQFKRTTETSSAASSILTTQTLGCEHINANTKEQGTKTHSVHTPAAQQSDGWGLKAEKLPVWKGLSLVILQPQPLSQSSSLYILLAKLLHTVLVRIMPLSAIFLTHKVNPKYAAQTCLDYTDRGNLQRSVVELKKLHIAICVSICYWCFNTSPICGLTWRNQPW